LSCETVKTENAEEAFHVLDHILAARIFLKLLDAIVEIKSGHVIRMSLSHLDEIDLELFVEFFPHRHVLVLRISEKLKILSDSNKSIPFE
jgi:hypothetical protein